MFTAICLSFARQPWLEEAIACWLAQDFTEERELLVYSTYEKQRLIGDFPNVRIINAPRPPNLGACRNAAISNAKDGWILTWDDDDLYAPWHVSSFAKAAEETPEVDWLWQSHQFYMCSRRIEKIVAGSPNVLAFKKSAWAAVGGYPPLTVGEDRLFLSRMMGRPGRRIQLKPTEVSLIYQWGQGTHHCSGLGDDVPGRAGAHQRMATHAAEQASGGHIKTGDVLLKPEMLGDYPKQCREFIERSTRFDSLKKNDFPVLQPGATPPYTANLDALQPLPSVTLVYIYVPGDPEHADLAGRFLATYTKCPPGVPHSTVIVCQGKNPDAPAIKLSRVLPNCSFFMHDDSGYDIGAFLAISPTLTCDFGVFCGGKTYFKRGGWMIRMVEAWKKHGPGFYGSLSSYEVSPHLNTSGFWCSPKMMERYPHKVTTTAERYNFEHGPYAMWRFCLRAGLPSKLVTWDGEFDWPQWRVAPNIYRRGNQSNCLTYFKHTDLFEQAESAMQGYMEGYADNITDIYFLKCLTRGNLQLTPYDHQDDQSWRSAMENMAATGILRGKR